MSPKVAVASPSFCKNNILKEELNLLKLKAKFEIEYNEVLKNLSSIELIHFLKDAEVALIGTEQVNSDIISRLPQLKMISKYGVGIDNIDIEECKGRDIEIGWTPGVNKRSVSEMTLGFILDICRNLSFTSNRLKNGEWFKDGGHELSHKIVGIVGLGNIGQDLVKLLQPFQCSIQYVDIENRQNFADQYNLKQRNLQEIFETSDIVTVHVPLTEKTNRLINYSLLKRMKLGGIFINTSRGKVVVQSDLKKILLENHLAGAAIDVYDNEPPTDLAFLKIPNLICTPHIGGNSKEAVLAMGRSAIDHVRKYFEEKN